MFQQFIFPSLSQNSDNQSELGEFGSFLGSLGLVGTGQVGSWDSGGWEAGSLGPLGIWVLGPGMGSFRGFENFLESRSS